MPPKASHSFLKDIAIFGAGGLGREVLMLIHQINAAMPTWNIVGFYDDAPTTPKVINEYPLLGNLGDLAPIEKPINVVIAIGNPQIKAGIAKKLQSKNIHFPVLMHPGVSDKVFQFNKIGAGSVICEGNILTTNITLGKHVFLNLGCTVGHDAKLKDYASLMPRVNIAGRVTLNQQVYLGTNASVLPGLEIGKNAIIGAGAVVTQNIPANSIAVGVPAKVIKRQDG